jgi:protein-disulfide isomerase
VCYAIPEQKMRDIIVSEESQNPEIQADASQSLNPEIQVDANPEAPKMESLPQDDIALEEAKTEDFPKDISLEAPKVENFTEVVNSEKAKAQDDMITLSRTTVNYVVIAVAFFAVGIVVGMFGFGGRSNVDEAAIEAAVSRVLIDAGVMMPPADMTVLVDDDPYLGDENAPIVIVEFSAYACPYCGRHFQQTFAPLLENYGEYIRYVYRDFPTINPNVSVPASLAANCANEQGKFWDYHNILFAHQDLLGPDYFVQAASDLGLDMAAFNTCVQEQTYIQEVNSDYSAGIQLGISGTPSFYINGRFYSGARPYEYFESIILRELEKAGIQPS